MLLLFRFLSGFFFLCSICMCAVRQRCSVGCEITIDIPGSFSLARPRLCHSFPFTPAFYRIIAHHTQTLTCWILCNKSAIVMVSILKLPKRPTTTYIIIASHIYQQMDVSSSIKMQTFLFPFHIICLLLLICVYSLSPNGKIPNQSQFTKWHRQIVMLH